jgi:hypothetical protein
MSYTLEWARERKLVTARHFGDVTTDEIQARMSDIEREIDLADLPYLLVDVRETTTFPNIADLYFLGEARAYRPRVSEKTAYVFNERTADAIDFVVIAASNRGCSVQGFTEESTAIDWLFRE